MDTCLIIANQTLASPSLAAAIAARVSRGACRFHVLVPATPVQHLLTWDDEETNAAAQRRLDALLAHLRSLGAEASGEIGSPDPIAAVQDVLRERKIDEIILSTLPPGISRWLGQDLPSRLESAVPVPVLVVTAPAESVSSSR